MGNRAAPTRRSWEFQATLRVNPNYAKAHLLLGVAYTQQGRTDEAIQEYQMALRVKPDDADAHFGLSVTYGQQGRTVEARREARLALQLGYEPAGGSCWNS